MTTTPSEALRATESDELSSLWVEHWEATKNRQQGSMWQPSASWRAGGRATKEYPNKEDESWWLPNGAEMLKRWAAFREKSGWQLWVTPEGIPAIELGINISLSDVPIKMALDRVMVTPEGELCVLDLKTGSRTPSSDFQLGMYAVGMEVTFGIRPSVGVYWMARDGVTSAMVDLSKWTVERITEIVKQFDTARKKGIFIPNFDHCKMCNITEHCKYQNGEIK
jgi:hypothetical protein